MKVLIVAGGTGGHISPGVSIYRELKKRGVSLLFVTDSRGLKFPIISNFVNSEEVKVIPISGGFSKNIFRNFRVFYEFLVSFFVSFRLILSFNPDRIILTGGYVSGPVGVASIVLRKKIILLEQNSVMGITNRILSLFASKVILTFPLKDRKKYPKNFERIGNPIRYGSEDMVIKEYAKNKYGFSGDEKVIGIILGSQGAKRVNEMLLECIQELSGKYGIIWATGQSYYQDIFEKCKNISNVKVFPFIEDVNTFMCAVDVVISRAGASTLSEIAFFGVPSILIPFPYASKNHQYYNALFFETHGAGIIIEESEISSDKLISVLDFVFKNIDTFRSNVKKLFPSDVNQRVVDIILSD